MSFSVTAGAYKTSQSVVVASPDPTALINVTTDGTTPATTGGVVGPIVVRVNATTTVKAVAVDPATTAVSPVASSTYIIDSIAPTASIALSGTQGAAGFYRGSVNAIITGGDTGGAGLASLRYSLDNGPLTDIGSGKNIPVVGDGKHTLSVTATDQAGNVNAPTSQTFTIATVAPTVTRALLGTSGSPNTFRGAAPLVLGGSDNTGGSGLTSFLYILDGGQPSVSTDGKKLWTIDAGAPIHSSANFFEGKIIFGTDGAEIFCLDIKGGEIWRGKAGDRVNSAPGITNHPK